MAKKGGNPQNFNNPEKKFTGGTLGVRVEAHIEAYVRSLPNKTEWLRKAIADAYERDTRQQQEDCV